MFYIATSTSRLLLSFLAILLFSPYSYAQKDNKISEIGNFNHIAHSISFTRTETPISVEELISNKSKYGFTPLDVARPHLGMGAKPTWLISDWLNDSNELKQLIFELDFAQNDTVHLYIAENDKVIASFKGGKTSANKRGTTPTVEFNAKPKERYQLIAYIETRGAMIALFKLWDKTDFYTHYSWVNIIWGLFYGTLLALSIYQLAFYFFARDKSQPIFTLLCLGLLAWQLNWNGHLHQFFPITISNWFGERPGFILFLITALASWFSQSFFNRKQREGKTNKLTNIQIGIALLCATASALQLFDANDMVGLSFLLISITAMLSIAGGIKAVFNGVKAARFYTLGWILLGGGIIIGVLEMTLILPYSEFATYAPQIGFISLVLAFSLALSDKIQLMLHRRIAKSTTTLRKQNLKLDKLTKKLEQANEAKSRFLANTSHEIRTPITSISGYAEALLHGDIPEKETPNALSIIFRQCRNLLSLINDLLDISKIEANKLSIEKVEFDLFAMLFEIEEMFRHQAQNRSLVFNLTQGQQLPRRITTDPHRLRQIIINLCNNAIKFTDHGTVTISCCYDVADNKLTIKVADTGIGLTEEQQNKLFEPFSQADDATTRKYGGTGLGLSISRNLALLMGGDISVSSELNKGSEFNLVLEAPPAIGSGVEKFLLNSKLELQQSLDINLNGSILLAEDAFENRMLFKKLLQNSGVAVDDVENGQQALELSMEKEYDLILMDIQMPVMDGKEALSLMKFSGVRSPIIALTANTMAQEVEQYLELGFVSCIAKPIEREGFLSRIAEFLPNQQQILNKPRVKSQEINELQNSLLSFMQHELNELESDDIVFDSIILRRKAHKIKGLAAQFGYQSLADLCHQVEIDASNEVNIAQLAEQLANGLQQAVAITKK